VKDYRDVMQADAAKNARFNTACAPRRVQVAGQGVPVACLTEADLAQVDEAIARCCRAL
jgi:hypothetical protein